MKNNLAPEQSQRLIELGVDPSKASCTVITDEYNETTDNFQHPIFGLTDLLELTPKEMQDEDGDPYGLQMDYDEKWEACYFNWVNLYVANKEGSLHSVRAPQLIDALFELLVWVLENHPDKIKKR